MNIDVFKGRMVKVLEHMEQEFAGMQVGRATSGLVDHIVVDAGYSKMPINQVSNVVVMDTSTIKIEPWDKSIVSNIEKGIYDADIGLTPQGMGDHLLVKIPPLTQERRKEIAKQVSSFAEDMKIRLRGIRHDAMKEIDQLKDNKEISEDEQKKLEKQVDDLTKEMTSKIESYAKSKQEEVMG